MSHPYRKPRAGAFEQLPGDLQSGLQRLLILEVKTSEVHRLGGGRLDQQPRHGRETVQALLAAVPAGIE